MLGREFEQDECLEFEESAIEKMREYMELNQPYERRATLSGDIPTPHGSVVNPNALFEEDSMLDAFDKLHENMLDTSEQAAIAIRNEKPPAIRSAQSATTGSSKRTSNKKSVRFFQQQVDLKPEQISQSKKSIFAQSKQSQGNLNRREFVSADDTFKLVLSDVVEKDIVSLSCASPSTHRRDVLECGFPDARTKRTTIFKKQQLVKQPCSPNTFDSIHQENLERLKSMSAAELRETRDALASRLDPSLVSALRKRALAKQSRGSESMTATIEERRESHKSPQETLSLSQKTLASNAVKMDRITVPEWIPPDEIEEDKLQWIFSSEAQDGNQESKAKSLLQTMRFGFNGLPIKGELPQYLGLHHHGEEAEKAGYSIKEILLLSRSTVPSQRTVGLTILGNIVRALRGSSEDLVAAEKDEIEYWLSHLNHVLYVRSSLADKHDTVFAAGLTALATLLDVPLDNEMSEEGCWQTLSLSRMGHRGFLIGVDAVTRFKLASRGSTKKREKQKDTADENSLQYVLDQLKEDAIKALLHTDIVDELLICIKKKSLTKMQFQCIVDILIRFSRHSIAFATRIVDCQGLLDRLCKDGLQCVWPSKETIPCYRVIRLLGLLVQSSRRNAEKILKSGYIELCHRFISTQSRDIDPELHQVCWQLQRESWILLNNIFSYKLGVWMIDEYRSLFLMQLRSFSATILNEEQVKTVTSLNRLLSTILSVFGKSLHIGETDDSFKPLIEASFSVLTKCSWLNEDAAFNLSQSSLLFSVVAAVSSVIDLLKVYCSEMKREQPQAVVFAEYLYHSGLASWSTLPLVKSVFDCLSHLTEQRMDSQLNYFHPRLESCGMGIRRQSRIETSHLLVHFTLVCDVLSSLVDMTVCLTLVCPRLWKSVHEACVANGRVKQVVLAGVAAGFWGWSFGVQRSDWIRVFGAGWIQLQMSWVEGCGGCTPLPSSSKEESTRVDAPKVKECALEIYKVGLDLMSNTLPGDEYLTCRIFHTCLTGESWRKVAWSQNEDVARVRAWKYLREYYDAGFWDNSSLIKSEGLYRRGSAEELDSLAVDLSDNARLGLPLAVSWIFAPLEMLVDESYLCGDSGDHDGVSSVQLVETLLEFVDATLPMTQFESKKYWNVYRNPVEHELELAHLAGLWYHSLNVYLIQSHDEVFREISVKNYIDGLFNRIYEQIKLFDKSHVNQFAFWLERAAGGQMNSYTTYRSLVTHYQSSSFGDEVFSKCLLLPFLIGFAPDYRTYFFTELTEMLRIFDTIWPVSDPSSFSLFFHEHESNRELMSFYVKALLSRSPDYKAFKHSFLGRISRWHVSKYLFHQVQVWKQQQTLAKDHHDVTARRMMVDSLVGSATVWQDVLSLPIHETPRQHESPISMSAQKDRLDYIKHVLLLRVDDE